MSLNKVMLIGRLGKDPELRYTAGGAAVANFTVATNERWIDKDKTAQERTEWHRVVVWGSQAENCQKYLAKGRQVFLEGRIQTRQWDDKDGNKRYTTEIVAQNVTFLGGRGEDSQSGGGGGGAGGDWGGGGPPQGGGGDWGGGGPPQGGGAPQGGGYGGNINDDDIPF
jgi:single-strand DNA-binding protein